MWFILLLTLHIAGAVTALFVIMRRTHQTRGTLAWVISLLGLPWLALPAYWLSGQVRYDDYAKSQTATRDKILAEVPTFEQSREVESVLAATANFSMLGFLPSADHKLYPDGDTAFTAMQDAINSATNYILLQSYLIRDDEAGNKVASALIQASERGCKVCLLFDELGSYELNDGFIQDLRRENISVHGFSVARRLLPKFRLNFRNHRKILVIDGTQGFVGGLNIGDEYVDGAQMFRSWRDTHLKITGPAVIGLQATFIEDWRFAHKGDELVRIQDLRWNPPAPSETTDTASTPQNVDSSLPRIGVCALGPHNRLYTGDLLFVLLVQSARKRLWIATPYFVPDDRVLTSLKAVGLKGVEVKILVPRATDHKIFTRVHKEFARELAEFNINMYYYEDGFMHQKVMLVDEQLAAIGSANFDNRSFRLNFEVVAVMHNQQVNDQVANMLVEDMETASAIDEDWQSYQSVYDKVATRACRLLAPVL